jgi:hypothetical protein
MLAVFVDGTPASAGGDPHAVASARAQAPMITLTGHPLARTHAQTTTIPFRAHGHPRAVSCRLDGGAAYPCQGPALLRSLAYGPHRLRVHAVNAFGTVTVTIRWAVLRLPLSTVVSTPVYVSPAELDPGGP